MDRGRRAACDGTGMTLDFIDRQTLGEPLYAGLAAGIEQAIRDGRLTPGERLPTHRALARDLGLSVHTVSKAYDRLRQHDLIEGHVGRGSYVADPAGRDAPPYALAPSEDELCDLAISRPLFDPRHDAAFRAVLRDMAATVDPAVMLATRPNVGLPAHRAAGAEWLARLGVAARASEVILTNGVAHGMAAALSATTRPGDVVLADAVTHHLVISLCRSLGLTLIGLEGDAEGMRPEALDRACRAQDARVLVTMPALTAPTAGLMGAARRREIARLAARHDLTVIENDAYGALLQDAPPPISAFARDRSVYLTTFTKCTLPGVRAGYMVGPDRLYAALLSRVMVFSWAATPLACEIAARWVQDGTAAALADWQRAALGERGRMAHAVLGRHGLRGHPGGLHYWLPLSGGWTSADFLRQAEARGIVLAPAEPFLTRQAAPVQAVRISVGGVADGDRFKAALQRIADLLDEAPGTGMPVHY